MHKIVLATANKHKVEEINAICKGSEIEFVMPPKVFNPIENGKTFEENALIKAKAANKLTGLPSLADDSGLCVDELGGLPGIFSARYAKTQKEKIQKMLAEMKNIPEKKRTAKFICAMVLLDKKGKILFKTRGECQGKIAFEAKGQNGFGFDPIFIVKGKNSTMAELEEDEKNKISHRGIALQKVLNYINKNLM